MKCAVLMAFFDGLEKGLHDFRRGKNVGGVTLSDRRAQTDHSGLKIVAPPEGG